MENSLINSFIKHLEFEGYKQSTLKNYRSDLLGFYSFFRQTRPTSGLIPSQDSANAYKNYLIEGGKALFSINRALSTLRKYSLYLKDYLYASENFMTGIGNVVLVNEPENDLIGRFEKFLSLKKIKKNTIRNYKSDIKHFLSWFRYKTGMAFSSERFEERLIEEYKQSLSDIPLFTARRRLSSLNQLGLWLKPRVIADSPKAESGLVWRPTLILASLITIVAIQSVLLSDSRQALGITKEGSSYKLEKGLNYRVENISKLYPQAAFEVQAKDLTVDVGKGLPLVKKKDEGSSFDLMVLTNQVNNSDEPSELFYQKDEQSVLFYQEKGRGVISAGETSAFIYSETLENDSFIYVTPNSSTNNQILIVENLGKGFFRVFIDKPFDKNILFSWIITK